MKFKNKVMLITYADSIGNNLNDLKSVLDKYFLRGIKGVHILPFYPSSADRGFAPKTYKIVNERFGNWDDIEKLAQGRYLMYDFMINHISKSSEYFKDYIEEKNNSKYKDLFINFSEFFENQEDEKELMNLVYKRKSRNPYIDISFSDGTKDKLWCTFSQEQIDLNIKTQTTKEFIKENLEFLSNKNANIIRLDAFAYATKEKGTNCFFIEPNVWEILDFCQDVLNPKDGLILPEIHEHYTIQMELSKRGYYVYDFALPMLLLYSLYSAKKHRLVNWLKICPRNQFTTLDTHDGIGVVDVKDLMSEQEIKFTREYLFENGANVKRIYNTEEYNNLDVYQLNCTYYSALGNDDKAYLLARAIQFFTPGIPQVYYVGLLAGKNDLELLEETKVGRNINRHYYSLAEIEEEVQRDVVKKLNNLMIFRNEYDAFNGEMILSDNNKENILEITWINGDLKTTLKADLATKDFTIHYFDGDDKLLKL